MEHGGDTSADAPKVLVSRELGRCLVCRGPLREELHLERGARGALSFAVETRVMCACGPHDVPAAHHGEFCGPRLV